VALVLAFYVGAQAAVAQRVAPQTEILGVELGDMSAADANSAVSAAAAATHTREVNLTAAGWDHQVLPADAGLAIDVDATLSQVTGLTLAPQRLWTHMTGGGTVAPVVDVDHDALEAAVLAAAEELDRTSVDATIEIDGAQATVVEGRDSVEVNVDEAVELINAQWPARRELELPATVQPATVPTAEAERLVSRLNGYVFAHPVTLTSPNGDVAISPERLSTFMTIEPDGNLLAIAFDSPALAQWLLEQNPDLENRARNARFVFDDDHQIKVRTGIPARALDVEVLGDAVFAAVSGTARSGPLPYVEQSPEITSDDLGIEDLEKRVVSFSTPMTPRGYSRELNLANAARLITGTVLQPNDTFSLTEALVPINRERGFVEAGVIINGEPAQGMGGGLSQISTTLYNAAYHAGLEDVEHRPHSEWFPRYPAGREATLYTGSIDLKFKNDTPYAIVINSYLENGRIYVDLWSTPHYEVEASSSGHFNPTTAKYRTKTDTPCSPSSPKGGFTVTDYRKVYLDGEIVKDETQTWTYRAVPGIRCEPDAEDD
jgi:vancomycin resistance protein YoaR